VVAGKIWAQPVRQADVDVARWFPDTKGKGMECSRRRMLLASLGLLATGCTQQQIARVGRPRGDLWPAQAGAGSRREPIVYSVPKRFDIDRDVATVPRVQPALAVQQSGGLSVIPRSAWTGKGPIVGKINQMGGINRITVHHEGWTLFWARDRKTTAARLEQIRKVHTDAPRGWGDIGYHYVIDRMGRLWQARDVRFQGAHVRANNPHNLGIMLLGNFQQQRPSKEQLDSLAVTLKALRQQYRVPIRRIYTHRELVATDCPGKNLQPLVVRMRARRHLG
jgi:hypothetical protein